MRNPKGTVVVESCRGRLRLRLPRQVFNGEQKYLSLELPDIPLNRKVAEAKAKLIESDIALERFDVTLLKYKNPQFADDNNPLLSEIWEKYTEFKSKTLAFATLAKDFKRTSNHISKLPIQRLSEARAIRSYLAKTLSVPTARKILTQIKACCNWAVDENIIPENPFLHLRIHGNVITARNIHPFSRAERDSIIATFESNLTHSHYTNFVKFLFLTGARTSEAIGLQWKHISPDLSSITFSEAVVLGRRKDTKTHRTRTFPINQQLRSLLKSIKPDKSDLEALVFTSKDGLPIDSHNFLEREWRPVLEKLPIPYRSQYNTRHTFISLCLESRVPVAQVANWSGNSPKTIYAHYAGIVSTIDVPEF